MKNESLKPKKTQQTPFLARFVITLLFIASIQAPVGLARPRPPLGKPTPTGDDVETKHFAQRWSCNEADACHYLTQNLIRSEHNKRVLEENRKKVESEAMEIFWRKLQEKKLEGGWEDKFFTMNTGFDLSLEGITDEEKKEIQEEVKNFYVEYMNELLQLQSNTIQAYKVNLKRCKCKIP